MKLRAGISAALLSLLPFAAAVAAPQVATSIPLSDGGWDLLTVDPGTRQVLIARADGIDAVDTRTGAVKRRLVAGTRFHGIALVPGTRLAVGTQAVGSATIFDVTTGKVSGVVTTDPDADATIYEPRTRTVWVMNGDSGTISIVDPAAARATGKIKVGGSLEMAALDRRGHLFVNVEDKGELAEVAIAGRKVIGTIALPGCEHPTGLAFVKSGLLLSACSNGVADLTRASDGRSMGQIAIGPRPDGAFADPARHRAYVPSGGDGTLTVIDTSGATPRKIATLRTQVGARTGAVDPATGAVYLPAANYVPATATGQRPSIVPGSVRLLVVR